MSGKLEKDNLLETAISEYEKVTAHVSTVVRGLLFGAVGIVWLFASGSTNAMSDSTNAMNVIRDSWSLKYSLLAAISGLLIDALHYLYASFSEGQYSKRLCALWDDPESNDAWRGVEKYGITKSYVSDNSNIPNEAQLRSFFENNPHLLPKSMSNWRQIFFWGKMVLASGSFSLLGVYVGLALFF